nr:MAG TPA: hypothetical protein [Caudoviricetes sp.]
MKENSGFHSIYPLFIGKTPGIDLTRGFVLRD